MSSTICLYVIAPNVRTKKCVQSNAAWGAESEGLVIGWGFSARAGLGGNQRCVEPHVRGRQPGGVEHALSALERECQTIRGVTNVVGQLVGGGDHLRGEGADRSLGCDEALYDGCLAARSKVRLGLLLGGEGGREGGGAYSDSWGVSPLRTACPIEFTAV